MGKRNKNSKIDSKLNSLAIKIADFRKASDHKRARLPDQIRNDVIALVTSGVKIHHLCDKTGLSYSGIRTWMISKSKFKSLKVIESNENAQKKSLFSGEADSSSKGYHLIFPSGVELEGVSFEGLVKLLEQGLL